MAGVAVCQFLVLPWGIHWLLEFSHWIKVEPELRLSEWLSFAILMPVLDRTLATYYDAIHLTAVGARAVASAVAAAVLRQPRPSDADPQVEEEDCVA